MSRRCNLVPCPPPPPPPTKNCFLRPCNGDTTILPTRKLNKYITSLGSVPQSYSSNCFSGADGILPPPPFLHLWTMNFWSFSWWALESIFKIKCYKSRIRIRHKKPKESMWLRKYKVKSTEGFKIITYTVLISCRCLKKSFMRHSNMPPL